MFHLRSNFFSAVLIGLFAAPMVEPALAASVQEIWYRVEVSGQAAGWMVERQIDADGRVVTESDLQISFRRAGAALNLGMSSRFIETADHQPIEMWTRHQLGAAPQETSYRFEDGAVIMNDDKRLDAPSEGWLTPAAADRELRERMQALFDQDAPDGGLRSVEISTLDPSLGLQVATMRWVLEQKSTSFELEGTTYPASRWRQSLSFAPQIESVVYLDENGDMLSSATPMMGLEMRFVRTSQEKAQSYGDGPELLVQSFIYPDRRIEEPRRLRLGAYRVTVDGEAVQLPEVASQRQEGEVVVVDLDGALGARPDENAEASANDSMGRYLQASTYYDYTAPEIQALHAGARDASNGEATEKPAAERAEAIRRLVNRHLEEKNLDSILATADEAAKARAGDCTEHAVLLTALLRADGIPSRTATGVLYVDAFAGKQHLFAYHMWSQAFLDGRWVDLDATLDDDTPFDATHLIFDVPDLDDEGSALMHMAGAAPLIGRAQIEVLDLSALKETMPEGVVGKETEVEAQAGEGANR